MGKKLTVFLILVLVALAVLFSSLNNKRTTSYGVQNLQNEIVYFYSSGCKTCSDMSVFLDKIGKDYGVEIKKFEVWNNNENEKLFEKFLNEANETNKEKAIPAVFFNDKAFIGFNSEIQQAIEEEVKISIKNSAS